MLIQITAQTILDAWKESLEVIYKEGTPLLEDNIAKNSILVLKINNISGEKENVYSEEFPMSFNDINNINQHLIYGTNGDLVVHEWTKLYRERLVNSEHNQIEEIINYLKKKPFGKRAQASIWRQKDDMYGGIGPCLQVLWFQIVNNKLDMHVHMRASDAYGKLLININEFAALQRYIADQVGYGYGNYYQFIDTCHINHKDISIVENIINKPAI